MEGICFEQVDDNWHCHSLNGCKEPFWDRRRLFLCFLLGSETGIAVVLIVAALHQGNMTFYNFVALTQDDDNATSLFQP